MICDKASMLLYAVTDRSWVGTQSLYEQVESALKGGATCIQLREKELSDKYFLREAIEMKALCHRYGVPLIINDNVELAIKCGADGVHVGQQDMEASQVRSRIGMEMILGVSAQTVEQALLAEKQGADYLGVGAVFTTATKADAKPVTHQTLQQICSAVSIPVCAIGGIDQHNIMELTGSGIDGVALVSAIFGSEDIKIACEKLRALSSAMIEGEMRSRID